MPSAWPTGPPDDTLRGYPAPPRYTAKGLSVAADLKSAPNGVTLMTVTARPAPKGLDTAGKKLWKQLTENYDWADCEERLHTAEMACRALDLAQKLQGIIDSAETLRTKGSAGQQVQIPEVQSLVSVRAQYTALMKSLMLSEADVPEHGAQKGGPMSRQESARKAASARWSRYG